VPASLIATLPKEERQQLLNDLNYLNMAEIKSFCQRHSIPYRISIETEDGSTKATSEGDRKGVVLKRIRAFLQKGVIPEETRFSASIVRLDPPPAELTPDDRVFYGQYDKSNRQMISLMKELTDGHFRDGAIARILAREFWARGKAPTFKEFAAAWLQAVHEHTAPNPEWAFLSDRKRGTTAKDWKKLRAKKAGSVLKRLNQIARPLKATQRSSGGLGQSPSETL
jgi:hypothetical protein